MALFTFRPLHLSQKPEDVELKRFFSSVIESVPRFATYQVTVDVPSIPAGGTAVVLVGVTGVTTEDIILVNQPPLGGVVLISSSVSAADQVGMVFWNPSGAPVDPAPAVFKIASIRR